MSALGGLWVALKSVIFNYNDQEFPFLFLAFALALSTRSLSTLGARCRRGK